MVERLRMRLEALGKTATGASVEAGLGRSAIHNILSGASESPRVLTLQKLAAVLECSVDYLTGESSDPDDSSLSRQRSQLYEGNPFITADLLEAEVFRVNPKSVRLEDMDSYFYEDARFPSHHMAPFLVGDNSMDALSILEGDIVFVPKRIGPHESETILSDGILVVVKTFVGEPPLEESSIRMVRLGEGPVRLICQSTSHKYRDIVLRKGDPVLDLGIEGEANVYQSEDAATVLILGQVTRVVRPL